MGYTLHTHGLIFFFRVLGQNGPCIKKNIISNHFMKLMFKLASLMPRTDHVIKIYIFFQNFN